MIEGVTSEKTRIITQGNYYRVSELCNSDNVEILLAGLELSDNSETKRKALLSSANSSLLEIKEGRKKCPSTPISFIEVIKKLSNTADTEKRHLILLAQAPWNEEQLTDDVLKKLAAANKQLADKQKVKKIILFGVNPKSASKLSKSFEVFNLAEKEVFESAAIDEAQMNLKLEQIRSKILINSK
jgi:hypothetical protein